MLNEDPTAKQPIAHVSFSDNTNDVLFLATLAWQGKTS